MGPSTVQRDWWRSNVDPKVELEPLIRYRTDTYDHYASKTNLMEPKELATTVEEFYYFIHFINDFQGKEDWYRSTPDKTLGYYCRYDRILGYHYDKKFGPPEKSDFDKYYVDNDLGAGPPLKSTGIQERQQCKETRESQHQDLLNE